MQLTIQDLRDRGLMLFEVISGSRAYGTYKPTSDTDYRGVYYLPIDNLLGYDYVEQVSDATNDAVYYEIGRFLQLLQSQNPNIIELFNMPEENIIYKHPAFDMILEHKDKFISKVCRDSFGGYAVAQIKKARGLNKKIVNPVAKERKSIIDFCYVIDGYSSTPLRDFMDNSGYQQNKCGLVNVPHARDIYAMFYDHYASKENSRLGYRGIVNDDDTSNEVRLSSIPKGEKPVATIIYNKDGYTSYCKDYKEYWEWVEKRNDDRYNTNQEHGKGYDCYLESETEFLTKVGWKRYDQIKETDLLGTINKKTLTLEWDKYTDKFDSKYSGQIYSFENRYTAFSVTENHNLFLADTSRRKENNFSTERSSEFKLETVSDFFAGRKSYKHLLINCESNNLDYRISDDLLVLFGLYISDGSLIKNTSGKPKGVSLSQVKRGNFVKYINQISGTFNIKEYNFFRNNRNEVTFNIYNTELAQQVYNYCSEYSENKKLPDYYLDLSKRQVALLLDSLMSGDGHKHKKNHWVYYSKSKKLIEQLHTLLTLNGYQCQTYYYENTHQLFILKNKNNSQCINKKIDRNFSWKIYDVIDNRIVCFTVPNGVIITKNKNKIAFQGNSKNMMHCIRLIRMAKEIAEQKRVIVKRPDADELMKIRNGEMEYDALLVEADTNIAILDEVYEKSDLPKSVDRNFVNQLLISFRKHIYELPTAN
jgi:uncharacterized protein